MNFTWISWDWWHLNEITKLLFAWKILFFSAPVLTRFKVDLDSHKAKQSGIHFNTHVLWAEKRLFTNDIFASSTHWCTSKVFQGKFLLIGGLSRANFDRNCEHLNIYRKGSKSIYSITLRCFNFQTCYARKTKHLKRPIKNDQNLFFINIFL